MAKKLLLTFYSAIIIFCIGLYVHSVIEFQQDLGRHLLLGKIIWQTHQVPGINLFSYTNYGFEFINTHWLSEVVFYLVSLVSIPSLVVLKTIAMTAAVLLTAYTTLRQNKNLMATLAAFAALSPILLERTEIRPEIFTYLFTSIFLFVILGSVGVSRISNWLWLLPILEIFWVNVHIYFILGPILVFFLFLIKRSRKYFILLALTSFATLLNPHFISGALYPLHVFDNYGYTIVENQNIFFLESLGVVNPNILYFKIGLLFLAGSFVVTNWQKIPTANFFLSVLVVLPLMNIRSFPLTFFVLLPVLATNLSNLRPLPKSQVTHLITNKKPLITRLLLIALLAIVSWRSYRLISNEYYLATDSEKRFGVSVDERGRGAVDFFLANNLPGPIFNNFDIGGYLDYRLYEKAPVYIDNRPEAFPTKFIQGEYIPVQQSKENFDTVAKMRSFKTIIFAHTDGTPWGQSFLQMINHHPDWSMVYLDDYAAIYIKNPISQSLDSNLLSHYSLPSSSSYLSYLSYGRLFSLINQDDLATQAFKKAYDLNPNSPLTNQAMSTIFPSLYQTHPSLPPF